MRVLLITDNITIAKNIEKKLKEELFNVYITDLDEEGIDLGKAYDYDIILLNINETDMSGYDILKFLRIAKIRTPILVLAGNSNIESKIKNLDNRRKLKSISKIPLEYDEQKYLINLEKHDIDFKIAQNFNHNSLLTTYDHKKDYNEARKIGIGMIDKTLYFVVYVRRGRKYRVISLRKANSKERMLYDKAINDF